MKKTLFLLLLVVFLVTTASVALAKPGESMELVCWKDSQSREQTAYFMTTRSGIVHRFKMDGKHDIYKPTSKFVEMPDESGWTLYTGSEQDPCLGEDETPSSYNDFVEDEVEYWHKYNN